MRVIVLPLLSSVLILTGFGLTDAFALEFGTPINVSNNGDVQYSFNFDPHHRIAVSGDTVYTVWQSLQDGATSDINEIYISVSTISGQTFGTPINISNNDGRSHNPQIAASGIELYD